MFMDRERSNELIKKMNLKQPEKRVYLSLWDQVVEWFAWWYQILNFKQKVKQIILEKKKKFIENTN